MALFPKEAAVVSLYGAARRECATRMTLPFINTWHPAAVVWVLLKAAWPLIHLRFKGIIQKDI